MILNTLIIQKLNEINWNSIIIILEYTIKEQAVVHKLVRDNLFQLI